jgi:hypothetical protein
MLRRDAGPGLCACSAAMSTSLLRTLLGSLLVAALASAPRPARADVSTVRTGSSPDEPAPPPAAPPPPYAPPPPGFVPPGADTGVRSERVWYGQPMLLVDIAASAMIWGAVELEDERPGLASLGGLTFVFGPPIVHLANGEVARGLASFGLRTSLPLTVALLGLVADSGSACRDDICDPSFEGFFWGGLVGMVSGALLDDFLLAHHEVRVAPSWTPTVASAPGGGLSFGVGGTF